MWLRLDDRHIDLILSRLSIDTDKFTIDEINRQRRNLGALDDAAFRTAVKTSDDLEVDPDAIVSHGEDGAFVMSWSWVSNEDAGIVDAACENCGCTDNDGSDICPDCGGTIE